MLIDKLLDYVKYPTQSDEDSNSIPSTDKQKVLGKHLLDEINKLGLTNTQMDEFGYVYATLPASKLPNIEASIGMILLPAISMPVGFK